MRIFPGKLDLDILSMGGVADTRTDLTGQLWMKIREHTKLVIWTLVKPLCLPTTSLPCVPVLGLLSLGVSQPVPICTS